MKARSWMTVDGNRICKFCVLRRSASASLWHCSAFCFLLSALSFRAWGQYSIDWSTIDGGGGTSSNGQYSLSGTIGQPDAGGAMTNGQYSVTGGFWALYAVQTEGAPTLTIAPTTPGYASISWSPATGTNWVLQETLNLSASSWSVSSTGWTNPVVVPVTLPARFYRLHKP
jgi:hypothetical protein